jgi:hypothetical protein
MAEVLASLRLLLMFEPGETPPMTVPRGLAVRRAKLAVDAAAKLEGRE